MIAIPISNTRQLMSRLLTDTVFDNFALSQATITTFSIFTIDGTWKPNFFKREAPENASDSSCAPWSMMRSHCYSIIKGKNTPLSFKFIFALPSGNIPDFIKKNDLSADPEDIFGLFFNITFDGENTLVTTGMSLKSFSLDTSLSHAWDKYVKDFFEDLS